MWLCIRDAWIMLLCVITMLGAVYLQCLVFAISEPTCCVIAMLGVRGCIILLIGARGCVFAISEPTRLSQLE